MTSVVDAKPRNDSIDFLKFLAVFLVLNSHMGICYGNLSILGTGGAIGDALFFFISGFTLFLGGKYRFDNWYKRRLSRIYPSVLATGLIACLLFKSEDSFFTVITAKRYWFVQCILIYYILLYPIKIYVNKVWIVFAALFVFIVSVWFLFYDFTGKGLFWGNHAYFRWMFFFLIMLQGAILGKRGQIVFKNWHLFALLGSVASWYGLCYCFNGDNWQILSIIPMFGVTYFLYSVFNSRFVKKNNIRKAFQETCSSRWIALSRELFGANVSDNRFSEQFVPVQYSYYYAYCSHIRVLCSDCFRIYKTNV